MGIVDSAAKVLKRAGVEAAAAAIRAYQRYISPRKGYGCAERLAGRSKTGCSGWALKVLARKGVGLPLAWALMRSRFDRCALAAKAARDRCEAASKGAAPRRKAGPALSQGGFCDAGCDAPSCDGCDMPSCGNHSCGCGWLWDLLGECVPDGGSGSSGSNSAQNRKEARREARERRRNKGAAPADGPVKDADEEAGE